MKKRSRKNDIRIGETDWIEWEKPTNPEQTVSIDNIFESASELWQALETECVHECCGIHSLGLKPKQIRESLSKLDKRVAITNVDKIIGQLQVMEGNCFKSRRLGQLFTKKTLLRVLNHVRNNIA